MIGAIAKEGWRLLEDDRQGSRHAAMAMDKRRLADTVGNVAPLAGARFGNALHASTLEVGRVGRVGVKHWTGTVCRYAGSCETGPGRCIEFRVS